MTSGASSLSKEDIQRLLRALADELAAADAHGELYLVGGAVMCLVLDARDSTHDLDAYFRPTAEMRAAAERIAEREGLHQRWLNDAVKGFLGSEGDFDPFLDLPHLKVFVAVPEYLLAMKCAAMRLGEEFQDLEDVRYLLRYLNVESADEALDIVTRYFDESQIQPETRLALEELLGG